MLALIAGLRAAAPTPEQVEFFEKRIRPVLAANCLACHGRASNPPMGGVRLDQAPDESVAARVAKAVSYGGAIKMPPNGKLPENQVADVLEWVKAGAPYPASAGETAGFWAFRPVRRPAVPAVRQIQWVQSPVDAFVLAKLEAAGKLPGPPASKRVLIRRVTFDLTGLPPTLAEVDRFLGDASPQAFEHVVDRLLASPAYGERWGRHWLDLVRYAETNGHEFDNDKLDPWRYRDYVIRAFNSDLPYNQFMREHVAGDLLPAPRWSVDGRALESPLGTSFFWFGEVLNSATDSVKARADQVDNQIDVIGKAFLGLTVACARCHNHKFDPIPTADYYAMAGVLHSTDLHEGTLDTPERRRQTLELSKQLRAMMRLEPTAPAVVHYRPEDNVFADFSDGKFGAWSPEGAAFTTAPMQGQASSLAAGSERFTGTLTSPKFRTGKKLYLHVRLSGSKADPKLKELGSLRFSSVCDQYKGQHIVPPGSEVPVWKTLTLTLERERTCYFEIVDRSREGHIAVEQIVFSDLKDPPPTDQRVSAPPGLAAMPEIEAQIPESPFAMLACDYEPHNVKVHIRGNPQTLGAEAPRGFLKAVAAESQPAIIKGSGRLEMADWLASDRNPLTARVMVNRIWKHHFGVGIVKSVDNFGAMGDRPSDPELLDFLSSSFMQSGWSVKAMHRMMLLSSTYQSELAPRRLEAEAIRDSMLAVAGTLDPKLYGASVPPHISRYQDGRGKPESGPLDGDRRRSVYLQVRRNFLTPLLLAFDYPLPIGPIGARGVSTVPSQALLFMNNEFVAQQARAWAKRALRSESDAPGRIAWMYRTAFAREPEAQELASIFQFVRDRSEAQEDVWSDVAQVLFSSPEFVYVQ